MPYTLVEDALGRVLAYLRGSGLTVTPASTRKALRLIEQALDEDQQANLVATVMRRLPDHFDLPAAEIPKIAPPVHHGSLHYAGHL